MHWQIPRHAVQRRKAIGDVTRICRSRSCPSPLTRSLPRRASTRPAATRTGASPTACRFWSWSNAGCRVLSQRITISGQQVSRQHCSGTRPPPVEFSSTATRSNGAMRFRTTAALPPYAPACLSRARALVDMEQWNDLPHVGGARSGLTGFDEIVAMEITDSARKTRLLMYGTRRKSLSPSLIQVDPKHKPLAGRKVTRSHSRLTFCAKARTSAHPLTYPDSYSWYSFSLDVSPVNYLFILVRPE